MTKIILIAALAKNYAIGLGNTLPWHLPEDWRHFKVTTFGKAVIMGRKTYASIGEKPLDNRRNIIVTRQTGWHSDGVETVNSLTEAFTLLKQEPVVYIAGGAQIYAASLPFADELYLTEIELTVAGDTFFPTFDKGIYREISRTSHQSINGMAYHIVRYVPKR